MTMGHPGDPIHVLHVTNLFPSVERPVFGAFVQEQLKSLERWAGDALSQAVHVIDRRARGWQAYLSARGEVTRYVAEHRVDVIHAHHLLSGVVMASLRRRPPLVVSFMNDVGHQLPGWPEWLESALFRFVCARMQTGIFKAPVPAGFVKQRVVHLPNGVDLDVFQPLARQEARKALRFHPDELVLLFVSANDLARPAKRLDRFRDVARIVAMHSDRAVRTVEVASESRDRMRLLYSAADCYVLTSDHEGSPNALKEALACDCRVVSTAVGSVPTLLAGVEGCAVSVDRDPTALARDVLRVCDGPRPRGRERLLEKALDARSVAVRLTSIYRQAATSSGASQSRRRK